MIDRDTLPANESELGDCSQLYHHTVPIIDYDRAKPFVTGTGVLVVVDQQHFVITAAHVFESGFEKVGFGSLKEGKFRVFGAERMRILTAKAQAGRGDTQRAVYKDGLDLAIIEPPDKILDELKSCYRFFDLRESSYSPTAQWGIVSGWPARKNIYNVRKGVCNFDTCYHIQCPIADVERIRDAGWNTDIYLGLLADKAKDFASATSGERIHLPKLEGISGGGMWVRSLPNKSSDHSNSTWSLAGIVIEDVEPKRMLKVIKIQHLWTPLFQHWKLAP